MVTPRPSLGSIELTVNQRWCRGTNLNRDSCYRPRRQAGDVMANDTDPPRKSLFVAFDPESAAIARELVTALLAARGSDPVVSSDDPPLLAADPQSDAFDHLLDHCQALIVVFVNSSQRTEGGLAAPLLDWLTEIIAKALANDRLAVVPLLIGDAEMPLAADLPPELAAFVQLPPVRLDDPQGPEALAHLLRAVERSVQVEAMLREARTALAEGQPDVAIRRMDELLSEIPGERRAQQLKAEAVERGLTTPPRLVADENVQFTVFRRSAIKPERWYPLLVFAHLSERRADAPPDEADPIAEVQAQAAQVLGEDAGAFRSSTEDAGHPVIREGELRVVPRVEGVTFNPPERRFLWTENVHREDFRMRADAALVGRTARGVVTVFAGNLILADIQIGIQVKAEAVDGPPEPSHARAYRHIFASYSHRDSSIVEEFEAHAAATGDRYVRDVITLRAGEEWDQRLLDLIKQADVFQLFWSWNALASPLVREEWQHALALNRPHFVRPVYWEEPLPAGPGLPPETLRRLHFQRVYPRSRGQGTPDIVPTKHVPPIEVSTQAGSGAPGPDAIRLPPQAREPLPAMRSTMRLIQYGSAVAACVLAVGLYATLNNNPAFIEPRGAAGGAALAGAGTGGRGRRQFHPCRNRRSSQTGTRRFRGRAPAGATAARPDREAGTGSRSGNGPRARPRT